MAWTQDGSCITRLEGDGVAALLGVPAALMGLIFTLFGAMGLAAGKFQGPLPIFLLGLFIGGSGARRVLRRVGTTIDVERGEVRAWQRLIVPLQEETEELGAFRAVALRREQLETRAGPRPVLRAYLVRDGGEDWMLQADPVEERIREEARYVAEFCDLPFEDLTGS